MLVACVRESKAGQHTHAVGGIDVPPPDFLFVRQSGSQSFVAKFVLRFVALHLFVRFVFFVDKLIKIVSV